MSNHSLHAAATAFEGERMLATGRLLEVARTVKRAVDRGGGPVVVFDDSTGRAIDLDLRGTADEVVARLASQQPGGQGPASRSPRSRGRPKLGVVSREVTLLPRHWAWLRAQRGGASATLRRLVEEARKQPEGPYRYRQAQDATYRFMSAMAGNEPGFEEAARALYQGDRDRFETESQDWPADVRRHARKLAEEAFGQAPESEA